MGIEGKFEELIQEKEKTTTSKRLLLALEAQNKLTVKEIKLHGEEKIGTIIKRRIRSFLSV